MKYTDASTSEEAWDTRNMYPWKSGLIMMFWGSDLRSRRGRRGIPMNMYKGVLQLARKPLPNVRWEGKEEKKFQKGI